MASRQSAPILSTLPRTKAMNPRPVTRREMLFSSAGATTAAVIAGAGGVLSTPLIPKASGAETPASTMSKKPAFRYCLNMSTIRGQELNAAEEIEVAGKAGYDAIEPWFRKINEYLESGGTLAELKQRIDDHGLTVESAIGFAPWIVNDSAARAAGFEEAKRDMDTIAQLGGLRIAAPPAGVPKGEAVELDAAAERYHQLLELGDKMGVVPQVEMWGGNPSIGTVEKAVYVAIRAGHPKACFLGDVYHTYKGGCDFNGLRLLGPQAMQVFHFNDYPADPPRETIKDEHRVYPGDGIAPITDILHIYQAAGATPVLSLEVFNKDYWAQDALVVAKTGLAKMQQCVTRAFE